MKLYKNTSLYQETIKTVDLILNLLNESKTPVTTEISQKLIQLSSKVACALDEESIIAMDEELSDLKPRLQTLIQL